ncbi:MAG TPA: 2OG-Fe(II) oxygenase [Stellaceae bacterium]|nr:2OG-Fe(II) oxygenase [Stellaceae bacterium]
MSATTHGVPLGAPVVVIDEFLPRELAIQMREDIDGHFADPGAHRADTHQVWNYWFVPELYAYLRTTPEKIIRRDRVDGFINALQAWSILTLGMGDVTWPYLSLYVDGCRQGLHNDAANGRFAFVYSLTRDQRRTTGGETLVFREGDLFRGNLRNAPLGARPPAAAAGRGFYEVIEPSFNRLVVFDDRLPHAVERVEGSMDPVEGRFVLHGHLSETGTMSTGALSVAVVEEALVGLLRDFAARYSARLALYQGPLALRFTIGAGGSVETCEILVDRVIHDDPRHIEWEPLRADLVNRIKTLKFPPAAGETAVTKPLVFGARPPGAA